jgi:hypothetical protein
MGVIFVWKNSLQVESFIDSHRFSSELSNHDVYLRVVNEQYRLPAPENCPDEIYKVHSIEYNSDIKR